VWLGFAKQILHEPVGLKMNITIALTGGQALRMLRNNPFDLVITDLRLFDMPGLDLIRHAKSLRPETEIAALKGRSDPATHAQVHLCGASLCLQKPVGAQELLDLIDWLREKPGSQGDHALFLREGHTA